MSLFGGIEFTLLFLVDGKIIASFDQRIKRAVKRTFSWFIYIFGIGIFWKGWILKRAECIILFGMWRNKRNKAFSKFSDLAWFVDRCIDFAFFRVKFLLGAGSWRKMMEFNDGWKLKSEVFDNSLCPLDIINPLYNLFYRYYIWSIDRELKCEEREREKIARKYTKNKRNCLISMTIIYLTAITLQIILFLRFNYRPSPRRIRINLHSLDYHYSSMSWKPCPNYF